MRCRYSEADIALYVEGDLDQSETLEMETHLRGCEKCRVAADDLRDTQSVFKSLRRDTVSATALSYVRTRVLAEVASGTVRPSWGRWVYAIAGSSLVVLLVSGWLWRSSQPAGIVQPTAKTEEPVSLVTAAVESPAPGAVRSTTVRVQKPKVVSHVRENRMVIPSQEQLPETETAAESPKQIVVKLLTDDPNIVIYWLVDQKTGGSL